LFKSNPRMHLHQQEFVIAPSFTIISFSCMFFVCYFLDNIHRLGGHTPSVTDFIETVMDDFWVYDMGNQLKIMYAIISY
jgi:hypothetical protein